jgi:glycerol-3-phosphate dehydrogenase (NAD(P)+)
LPGSKDGGSPAISTIVQFQRAPDATRSDVRPIDVIGVAGAGAWGVALANAAAAAGREVILWGRNDAGIRAIATTRRSDRLPGVDLALAVETTSDLARLGRCDAILVATPAQSSREIAMRLATAPGSAPLVACAKGIERGTRAFMTEVLAEAAPDRLRAILSGPSFAADVAAGLPTAVTLASTDEALARALCDALRGPTLRLYHSTDVRGVEIGGAAKNVLAIACGVTAGRGLGASAIAALTARGFAELRRFGEAFGARGATLMGLSGLGDLVLTCSSPQSRNFAFGLALGRGASLAEAGRESLAEGRFTALALTELARERGVEMPIADCVQGLIEGSLDVKAAVSALLARPQRGEE